MYAEERGERPLGLGGLLVGRQPLGRRRTEGEGEGLERSGREQEGPAPARTADDPAAAWVEESRPTGGNGLAAFDAGAELRSEPEAVEHPHLEGDEQGQARGRGGLGGEVLERRLEDLGLRMLLRNEIPEHPEGSPGPLEAREIGEEADVGLHELGREDRVEVPAQRSEGQPDVRSGLQGASEAPLALPRSPGDAGDPPELGREEGYDAIRVAIVDEPEDDGVDDTIPVGQGSLHESSIGVSRCRGRSTIESARVKRTRSTTIAKATPYRRPRSGGVSAVMGAGAASTGRPVP